MCLRMGSQTRSVAHTCTHGGQQTRQRSDGCQAMFHEWRARAPFGALHALPAAPGKDVQATEATMGCSVRTHLAAGGGARDGAACYTSCVVNCTAAPRAALRGGLGFAYALALGRAFALAGTTAGGAAAAGARRRILGVHPADCARRCAVQGPSLKASPAPSTCSNDFPQCCPACFLVCGQAADWQRGGVVCVCHRVMKAVR